MKLNYTRSEELNGMDEKTAIAYFLKYPHSNKLVCRVCKECGSEKDMRFDGGSDLCDKCGHNTPEARKHISDAAIKRSADPEYKKRHLAAARRNPLNPDWLRHQSESMGESDAVKANIERMRGGNDLLMHHFIYDHNNPTQHTVEMTRAEHSSHHLWMRRNQLHVPHFNMTEENKDIFNIELINMEVIT